MKRILVGALLGACVLAIPANATLPVGAKAPDFTAQASLGGKEFSFTLADALKKGPVVLYFYPAAFTPGCTVEAHEFGEATDKFAAARATPVMVRSATPEWHKIPWIRSCQSNSSPPHPG